MYGCKLLLTAKHKKSSAWQSMTAQAILHVSSGLTINNVWWATPTSGGCIRLSRSQNGKKLEGRKPGKPIMSSLSTTPYVR